MVGIEDFLIGFASDGIISGAVIVVIISLISYYSIILLSSRWVEHTYIFENLSGILVTGIPVEELVFWFFAGMVFGPFYEYWKSKKLRRISKN